MSGTEASHLIDRIEEQLARLLPARTLQRMEPGADLFPVRRLVPPEMLPSWLNKAVGLENRLNMKIRPAVSRLKARLMQGHGLDLVQVGNIAMYGLLNALALERSRCRSDVVCFDFYHFAATPEFHYLADDPTIDNVLDEDHYFTNFWRVDHAKRQRPRWFAQGPLPLCFAYLMTRRVGPEDLQDVAWACLEYGRLKCLTEKTYLPQATYWDEARLEAVMADLSLSDIEKSQFRMAQAIDGFLAAWRDVALRFAPPEALAMIGVPFAPGFLDQYLTIDPKFGALIQRYRRSGLMYAAGFEVHHSLRGPYPVKPEDVEEEDWLSYAMWARHWRNLFEQYDAAILHAGYPILGHMCGYPNYFGYEIGTIRHIPFEGTPTARQVYRGYQHSKATFVTNSDYPLVEQRIEGLDSKVIFTPHAFIEDKAINFGVRTRATMQRPKVPTFLSPARQLWVDRPIATSKCNDLIVRAARKVVDAGRPDFEVHFVEWGPDVDATKALIQELGVERQVLFVPTMPRHELWAQTCSAAAVVDQFGTPALGGVAFETLALGTRLITHTFEAVDVDFFGAAPPLMRASNPDEIANQMIACIDDPDDTAGRGQQGIDWIRAWHSADRVASLASKGFVRYL
jgi:glycosyltransferase involved in cell wall biosynthesis